jgi:hypothetical protein
MKESIFNYMCDVSKGMLYSQKRTGTLNFIKKWIRMLDDGKKKERKKKNKTYLCC